MLVLQVGCTTVKAQSVEMETSDRIFRQRGGRIWGVRADGGKEPTVKKLEI